MMAFAAIAAVSMSSCSNNEELVAPDTQFSNNAVEFGTYIGKNPSSRVAPTTTATFQESKTGFGVMAYYTETAGFGATSTPNFMYNQQVVYTDGAWTYSPLKYWPNNANDKISFFAYAPYTKEFGETGITALSANTAPGDPTLTFKMDNDVTKHVDLLYAEAVTDQIKPGATDRVKLNFKHALCRVNFQRALLIDGAEGTALDAKTTLTITKVTFSPANLGVAGTLNLNTGTWDVTEYATNSYELTSDNFVEGSAQLTSTSSRDATDLTNSDSYMMFIPVASPASRAGDNGQITVEYTVSTEDGNLKDGFSTVKNKVTVPFNITFEAGKAYNLVLKIGLTSVKLDASVAKWEDGEIVNWESIF